MNEERRNQKEGRLINVAADIFARVGYKNAKMDDIAAAAKVTKVTLYSYFQSKENLYMAITYKAMAALNNVYRQAIEENASKSGLESVLALLETFMEFCASNYFYSEVLLEYFSVVRSTSAGKNQDKLTVALKDSPYLAKVKELHNLPFKWTVQEIERGKADGSIKTKLDSMLCTLHGWTTVVGYIKVLSASGANASPLFKVDLTELKKLHLKLARIMFEH